jgi:hypothetical protein
MPRDSRPDTLDVKKLLINVVLIHQFAYCMMRLIALGLFQ